jgi:hypothetical protein
MNPEHFTKCQWSFLRGIKERSEHCIYPNLKYIYNRCRKLIISGNKYYYTNNNLDIIHHNIEELYIDVSFNSSIFDNILIDCYNIKTIVFINYFLPSFNNPENVKIFKLQKF